MRLCNDCDLQYKQSQNKRLLVELTLIEVAQTAQGEDIPGSGRSPKKIIKPIFAVKAAQPANTATAHTAGTTTTPTAPAPASTAPAHAHIAPATYTISDTSSKVQEDSPNYKLAPDAPQTVTPNRKAARSFSIRGTAHQTATPASQPRQDREIQTSDKQLPCDAASVIIAWKEFIEQLPQDDAAMAQRMRNIEPSMQESASTFEVIANNAMVEQELTRIAPRIEDYVNRRISGGKLKMAIRLRKATDKKTTYNPAEQFAIMCKENEVLLKLKDTFSLELV